MFIFRTCMQCKHPTHCIISAALILDIFSNILSVVSIGFSLVLHLEISENKRNTPQTVKNSHTSCHRSMPQLHDPCIPGNNIFSSLIRKCFCQLAQVWGPAAEKPLVFIKQILLGDAKSR